MSRLSCGLLAAATLALAAGARAEVAPPTPEYWEVTGVNAGDTLNLRESPSTGAAVVAELARGTVLHNLGCQDDAGQRWCEVELAEGGVRGWAAARYLLEHVAAAPPAPDTAPATPAAPLPAVGELACSLNGAPVPTCPYAIQHADDGTVEVVVTFPDGFERVLAFAEGEVWSPDPTDEVTARSGDGATIVEVNGVERIEVPDAVVPRS